MPDMNQPNLQAIVQDMLVDYTAWVNGEPVAWNVKKQEAIDAIYAAGLSAIEADEVIDEQVELAHDKWVRNELKAEQRKAWQRVCYGDKEPTE